MAFPASFDESNAVLARPAGMTHQQCEPLSVLRAVDGDGIPIVISCWKLTKEEMEEVQRTGRVWLGIIGQTMPPAWIDGCKPFDAPRATVETP